MGRGKTLTRWIAAVTIVAPEAFFPMDVVLKIFFRNQELAPLAFPEVGITVAENARVLGRGKRGFDIAGCGQAGLFGCCPVTGPAMANNTESMNPQPTDRFDFIRSTPMRSSR